MDSRIPDLGSNKEMHGPSSFPDKETATKEPSLLPYICAKKFWICDMSRVLSPIVSQAVILPSDHRSTKPISIQAQEGVFYSIDPTLSNQPRSSSLNSRKTNFIRDLLVGNWLPNPHSNSYIGLTSTNHTSSHRAVWNQTSFRECLVLSKSRIIVSQLYIPHTALRIALLGPDYMKHIRILPKLNSSLCRSHHSDISEAESCSDESVFSGWEKL